MTTRWSVSTEKGANLAAEEVVRVLDTHHQRLIASWRSYSPTDWQHRSRCTAWSVHDTVRHVADAMERGTAQVCGDEGADLAGEFDPRTTPVQWLKASDGEPPERTIERFERASSRLRQAVAARLRAGDDAREPTVYGTAHWSVNVVHLLWDSWLHERDVAVPLGWPDESSVDERRLVALYAVLMALVPSMMMGQSLATTVRFTGVGPSTIRASCDAESVTSSETSTQEPLLTGDLSTAVDALAGRGSSVAEALPGAPEPLGILAAFFTT